MRRVSREGSIRVIGNDQPQIPTHHARLRRILTGGAQLLQIHLIDRLTRRSNVAVAIPGRTPSRALAESSDPDRRVGLLNRPWTETCAVDVEVLTVEADGLALP